MIIHDRIRAACAGGIRGERGGGRACGLNCCLRAGQCSAHRIVERDGRDEDCAWICGVTKLQPGGVSHVGGDIIRRRTGVLAPPVVVRIEGGGLGVQRVAVRRIRGSVADETRIVNAVRRAAPVDGPGAGLRGVIDEATVGHGERAALHIDRAAGTRGVISGKSAARDIRYRRA